MMQRFPLAVQCFELVSRYPVWLLCLGALAGILGTHIPLSDLPFRPFFMRYDKLAHFGEYAGLMVLVLWALYHLGLRFRVLAARPVVSCWCGYALLMGFALFDETTQSLTGRHRSLPDLTADLAGAGVVVAAFMAWIVLRVRFQRIAALRAT
jgi:VanZ family protein